MKVRVTYEIGVFEGEDKGDDDGLDNLAVEAADLLVEVIHHDFPDVRLIEVSREHAFFSSVERAKAVAIVAAARAREDDEAAL